MVVPAAAMVKMGRFTDLAKKGKVLIKGNSD